MPWLGWTCGTCAYCTSGRENLCPDARFTGRDIDGGFAEYAVADERFCFAIPDGYPDVQAAPLLCAGLIGYRALRFTGDATNLGLYGFGAAAHIIAQVAVHQGRRVFAVSRRGHDFARELGAVWAGIRGAARAARRRDHLRARRRARPARAGSGEARRHRGLRRHPHERHPELPVRAAVARADTA